MNEQSISFCARCVCLFQLLISHSWEVVMLWPLLRLQFCDYPHSTLLLLVRASSSVFLCSALEFIFNVIWVWHSNSTQQVVITKWIGRCDKRAGACASSQIQCEIFMGSWKFDYTEVRFEGNEITTSNCASVKRSIQFGARVKLKNIERFHFVHV